ncbi:ParA family protein [Clostridium estertheticum]|uniref:ParA family protein n=1 Tax=Clostridium estertheticum TaxID=238834 RepID=UPI001CF480CE|nr:ParA family protein [Clostridium estertheticum]MCB2306207.1 ParA family protein [Clostridium estertheticum]MCB2344380.1 ParA family protein [Clostridium estertheticum]MCB2349299.1 ParA family protein [Clostridium estertheticum]WAG45043.1 ParA family protein [Clostridium estertheticum]
MEKKLEKYAVLNNKGGVGKSTIAVNIAHGLAIKGKKVLLIDMDGQNDASLFLGFNQEDYKNTLYDIIVKHEDTCISDCIIKARDNLDLLPSRHIDQINEELYKEPNIRSFFNDKFKDLEKLNYDYVIVDCGPQRCKINDAVLCFVDGIIVPVQVEAASVRAIGNIYEYLFDLNLDQSMISLVVPNMFDQRTSDGKENMEFMKGFFSDTDILTAPIHRRIKITQSGKMGKTVFECDEESSKQFEHIVERLVSIHGSKDC